MNTQAMNTQAINADTDNAKTAETNSAIGPSKGGPKTPAGKAVAARNATTHGLFCRQTVLPHLGEDPQAYAQLLDRLKEQLRPRNLMEEQYLELWADASWKLRRLSRLEAQLWENDSLDEDQRLTKLERLSRLQASTRRQLDKAVRMLTHDVHDLFAHRTREDVLHRMDLTESQMSDQKYRLRDVERTVQANTYWLPLDNIESALDTAPNPASVPSSPPPLPDLGEDRSLATGVRAEGVKAESEHDSDVEASDNQTDAKNAQNELPQTDIPAKKRTRLSRALPETPINVQRERWERLEDLLNNPEVPLEERRSIITSPDTPTLDFVEGSIRIRA